MSPKTAPYIAPVIMWIIAPRIAVPKTKWKSLPDIASCIEAIIASPGAHKEAMW